VNPLRAYIYREGIARFSTEDYKSPNMTNIDNQFMHLTNYAINRLNPQYFVGDKGNTGHKRLMSWVLKYINKFGPQYMPNRAEEDKPKREDDG
jgi:tubulin polyglutamylase TTLL6/13